jgi:hypothetical protein
VLLSWIQKQLAADAFRRNSNILTRGVAPDGLYLLLEGSLSVYAAQKVAFFFFLFCSEMTRLQALIASSPARCNSPGSPKEVTQVR